MLAGDLPWSTTAPAARDEAAAVAYESVDVSAHLSHLVNMSQVRMYLHRDGGTLVLTNGQEVPVSHRRRQDVMEALGRKNAKG